MTFQQWADDPSQDRIVLAEIQPAEQVGAFTLNSGVVYQVSWKKYVQTTVIGGGLYRRLDSVRENGTVYSSQSSIVNCQANAGSYFYDSANDLLYVHTTTGSAPDTFSFIGTWFTIFTSTQDPKFTDQPIYEPRLTGTLPKVTGEKPDELFGATIFSEGQLTVANGDAAFDILGASWIWENKTVTLKVGGSALGYSSYATMAVMKIVSANVDDLHLTLDLTAMANVLNRNVPPNTIASTLLFLGSVGFNLANNAAASPVLGESAPIILGQMLDVPLRFIYDDGSAVATYMIWDYSLSTQLSNPLYTIQNLYAINRATGVRTRIGPTFTDVNAINSNGTYGINTTSGNYTYRDSQGYDLRADIIQNSGPLAGGIVTGLGSIAYTILVLCGEIDANIDKPSFVAIDTNVGYVAGLVLNATQPASDAMRQVEQSGLLQVYWSTALGKWTARVFDPTAAVVTALVAQDFSDWEALIDEQSVLSDVRVQYAQSWATGSASEISRQDSATQYGRESTDTFRIGTLLAYSYDAQELCDRYAFLKQRVRKLVTAPQRNLALITINPGDFVSVTRDRGPTLTGAYAGDSMLIRAFTIQLAPTIAVTVTLDDMAQLLTKVGVYADDAGYDWSTATADQKRTLCFYSDDNGFIDPTDMATKNRKVYW